MIHKLIISLLIFTLLGFNSTAHSTPDFEQRLYDTYIQGRISEWQDIISEMTVQYENNKDAEMLYSLSFAQYGYIGYCLGNGLEDEANEIVDNAIRNARELYDLYEGRHDIAALRGALMGFKIVLSNFNSIYLGPKSLKLIKSSTASADTYFNCSLEMANLLFYTPRILGGSKDEAMAYYVKAVEVIEQSTLKQDRNWIYMNTVILLANAYVETGSKELACDLYEGLMEYEPRATWIRDDLYSKCSK